LGQAKRVVLVGLALEVLELPGFARRVGDQTTHAAVGAPIVNPARQQTGLDDDDRGLFLAQQLGQFGLRGIEACKAHLACGLLVNAGNALVFPEVDGENAGRGRGFRDRVHGTSSSWGCWGLIAW
jgi:hypothetical protein